MGSRVRLHFGKYRGDYLEDVPTLYLWRLLDERPGEVDAQLAAEVQKELLGRLGHQCPRMEGRGSWTGSADAWWERERPTPPSRGNGSDPRPSRPSSVQTETEMHGMTRAIIEAGYRALALRYHPDRGGDVGTMAKLNQAVEELRRNVK